MKFGINCITFLDLFHITYVTIGVGDMIPLRNMEEQEQEDLAKLEALASMVSDSSDSEDSSDDSVEENLSIFLI